MTQKSQIIAFALAVFAMLGCSRQRYDLERAFDVANDAYFGRSRTDAQHALVTFVAAAENNEVPAKREHSLDYDRVLGMAWLKLWSVYAAAGDHARAAKALDHAVSFFDRDPQLSADPRYVSHKRKALIDFLNRSETYQKPEWKRP